MVSECKRTKLFVQFCPVIQGVKTVKTRDSMVYLTEKELTIATASAERLKVIYGPTKRTAFEVHVPGRIGPQTVKPAKLSLNRREHPGYKLTWKRVKEDDNWELATEYKIINQIY